MVPYPIQGMENFTSGQRSGS